MTITTAHKILIGSAIAMFALYGSVELRNYSGGDSSAWLRAALAFAGAIGLGAYLRWFVRKQA